MTEFYNDFSEVKHVYIDNMTKMQKCQFLPGNTKVTDVVALPRTGTVNGKVTNFMVDTGATLVSVSDEFANWALLQGGESTTFKTANGDRPGRIVTDVAVSVDPVTVPDVRVGIGLTGDKANDALLGQSFLSRFDVMMNKDQMVLRPRL